VTKLVEAIEEAERLAKASGRRTRTGGGGVSHKERWYQLMGYLAQVLDGVLKNLDLESVKGKMDQMETFLDELEDDSDGWMTNSDGSRPFEGVLRSGPRIQLNSAFTISDSNQRSTRRNSCGTRHNSSWRAGHASQERLTA
jgi:hypothetical protein